MTIAIANPAGAFSQSASYPAEVEFAVAANSISAGELVALSTSPGYVIRNLVATADGLQYGVALNTATAGKSVGVVVGGWATVNKGTAAVTAGNAVKADDTVSGAVGAISAGFVISTAGDARGIVGTVVADASAAATTCVIAVGHF